MRKKGIKEVTVRKNKRKCKNEKHTQKKNKEGKACTTKKKGGGDVYLV